MSKIASDSPTAGAISTDPSMVWISASMPLPREISAQDVGIGGCDAPSAEVVGARVVGRVGDGQREAAGAESERHRLFDVGIPFGHLVLADDTQVGDAHRDGLRDVVVAQEEHFERKSFGAGDEPASCLHAGVGRLKRKFKPNDLC